MDRFTLIINFGREKKGKIGKEWMIQLYFASLRRESKIQLVVGLPYINI